MPGGPVNVNVEAATRRKIPVLNSPGRNAAATAEFTVGLILAGMRRICLGAARMKEGVWDGSLYMYRECGEELEGKTAGVVGLGNVGRRVARLLGAFGMRVLAYDPWVPSSAFRQVGAEAVDLPTLLKHSQILTLHARLTPETRGLIGKRELAQLPKGAFVANAARGGLLDYEALYEALEQGHLSGAALDVYDPEPFPESHPLLSHSRVVATPHIAGATRESALRGAERVAEDLSRLMRGGKAAEPGQSHRIGITTWGEMAVRRRRLWGHGCRNQRGEGRSLPDGWDAPGDASPKTKFRSVHPSGWRWI